MTAPTLRILPEGRQIANDAEIMVDLAPKITVTINALVFDEKGRFTGFHPAMAKYTKLHEQ